MTTKRWKTILEALDDVSKQTDEAIEADSASEDEMPPESGDNSDSEEAPPTDDSENSSSEDSDDLPDEEMPPEDSSEEPEDGSSDYGMKPDDVANATVMQSLEQIYTPILIAQSFQTEETKDQIQENVSNLGLLTESNMMKFDNETKLAQLQSVCALLLSRQEQSEKFKAFVKSYQLTKKLKIILPMIMKLKFKI